jgi:hypothetical protein
VIACSSSTLLFGQTPANSRGKVVLQKSQMKSEARIPSPTSMRPGRPSQMKNTPGLSPGEVSVPENKGEHNRDFVPPYRNCFTVESEKRLTERFPSRLSTEAFEKKMRSSLATARLSDDPVIYKIPTVVHVVHYGEPVGIGSNISNEQIMSQFDVLNEDFRKLGAGYNEHPSGADIHIEFVPALVDPQGKALAEPGVDRISGYSAYYEYFNIEFELKPNTQWDPDRYFNIWVVNFGGSFANYLGYAQFPSFSGLDGLPDDESASTDGVVIGYKYFGRTGNVVAPFDKGRTTTHEVGHWLGLRHIWGDGDCSVDDFCADTPNSDGPNRSCEFRDSCPGEGPDMIENYMDYTTDGCMNVFTNDQRYRIRTVMEVSPRRSTLVACQDAPLAVIGNNLSMLPRSWFEYTAIENELVTISSVGSTSIDTKLSLYRDCNALPLNVSDNALGTVQSELSVALMSGETLKILWESAEFVEPFEWTLIAGTQTTGAACEIAKVAVEGSNTVPATILNTYWFRFSPAADNQKISINSNGKKFNVYGNNCNQLTLLDSRNPTAIVYDISANESIYIEFETEGENFNWTLDAADIRDGESCDDAVVAVAGENLIPYAAPFEYWYSYTMPSEGIVTIKSAEIQGAIRLAIYRECGGLTVAEATGSLVEQTIHLKAGETIRILWDGEDAAEEVIWTLESAPYNNGEICGIAKPAIAGVNHTDVAPQWFTYTITNTTNLEISSVGLTDVDTHLIIKRDCNGPITDDNDNTYTATQSFNQAELVLFGLNAGEKIYILWSEKWSYEGFDWSLEEIDPLPGDNCETAKQAVVGTNTVRYRPAHNHFGNIYWAKFTVPADGKKITAFASLPVDMAIYSHNNCGDYEWIDGDQGKGRAFNLIAGTELLFIWDIDDYKQDFTWELSVEDIAAGDLCSNPIRAVHGVNTSQYTPIWYDYVMSQPGSLKVSYQGNTSAIIPYVALLDGCGDEANILFQNSHAAFVSGLNEGDRILIYWTVGYPFTGAEWLLEEIPLKQGDTCADPLPATYGLNHADYATQWFTYTPEVTGNLIISSRAFTFNDTDLYIYDACDGNLLAESNDIFSFDDFILYFQSEVLLENIAAGQSLLIKWAGTYSFEPFDWEIVTDNPRQGDSCEDPLTAVEGVNNGMKPTPAWFSFTMPRTSSLTLTSLGYSETNTYVEVYDECNGNLIASNDDFGDSQSFLHIDELTEGQTVLIHWSNSAASEKYTFPWRLFVGGPDPGLVCQFPAEAQIGLNSTPAYVSNYYWYSFIMPEDNKRLIVRRVSDPPVYLHTVGVTRDCDSFQDLGIGDDEVVITGLAAGEEVFIFWGELIAGEREGFDWELIISDLEQGDSCEEPIPVSNMVYHSTGAATWYQYTPSFSANVLISSVGINDNYVNTYVEVYDACNGNLIASNDNPDDFSHYLSEVSLQNIGAGQSLWIKWGTALPFQTPFDWKLTVENLDNHAPSFEDIVFELDSNPVNGLLLGTLAANDEDGDDLTYAIASGNEDDAFALHPTSGQLTIADAVKVDELNNVHQLEVTASDGWVSTQATVTIDLVTAIGVDEENFIVAFPNPASDVLQLQLSPQMRVFESRIVDVSGSVVRENDPLEREIPLTKLKQGIYFLKITSNKGQHMLRLAILR